jgi:hypothetical protein
LLAEVRGGSNSGDKSAEQLLPIRASSAESEGTAAFVSSRASLGAFDSSIGSPNLWQLTDFSSTPAKVFFTGEKPPLLCLGFLRFFGFPSVQGLPHSLLTFPGGGAPSPSVSPPVAPLFPIPAAVAAPSASQPDPTSPAQPPPVSSMDGRKKMREKRRWQFCKFSPHELQYGLKHSQLLRFKPDSIHSSCVRFVLKLS